MSKESESKASFNPMDVTPAASSILVRSFSDELILNYVGRDIAVYLGDQQETQNLEEVSTPMNAVIYGRLREVLDRFLILDCYFIDRKGQLRTSNTVLINAFQVRIMTAFDEEGDLNDIFLTPKHAAKLKKLIGASR